MFINRLLKAMYICHRTFSISPSFVDCGEPYVVESATVVPGAKTIGAVQVYECIKGIFCFISDLQGSH